MHDCPSGLAPGNVLTLPQARIRSEQRPARHRHVGDRRGRHGRGVGCNGAAVLYLGPSSLSGGPDRTRIRHHGERDTADRLLHPVVLPVRVPRAAAVYCAQRVRRHHTASGARPDRSRGDDRVCVIRTQLQPHADRIAAQPPREAGLADRLAAQNVDLERARVAAEQADRSKTLFRGGEPRSAPAAARHGLVRRSARARCATRR